MLYKLSLKYQKEIALSLFSLFFISFLAPLKANNFGYDISYEKYSSVDNSYKYFGTHYFRKNFSIIHGPENIFNNSVLLNHKRSDNIESHHSLLALKRPDKLMIGGPTQPEMA